MWILFVNCSLTECHQLIIQPWHLFKVLKREVLHEMGWNAYLLEEIPVESTTAAYIMQNLRYATFNKTNIEQ